MSLPLTPIRFLARAVDLFGSKIGVISGDRQFTYAEFGERCRRLAAALKHFGVAAGDRVAYLSLNNHQLLEGYYGVPAAGAIVMPLNVRLAPAELAAILQHAEASVLFYESDFAPLVERLAPACPGVRHHIELNKNYEQLLASAEPAGLDYTAVDENSIGELFYTSGSTGTPKGVMLTHRTLYLHGMSVATLMSEPETMVDLHTIPLFHANGWGRPQASTMLGSVQVMVRRFDPPTVLALIERHRATDMCLVPTMANALLNCPDIGKHDLSSLRTIMIGGAASSPELVERMEKALGCRCVAGYGLTETAPVLTMSRPKAVVPNEEDRARYHRQAMAGWPVPGVELRVVDMQMRDVPRDMTSIGEIVARGDHIMAGYYKDEAGTASVMTGGWFHTGDMAVWDTEGYIHIVDRRKEIIISGGENISSLEVEKAIYAHPDVFECAVVAAPDPQWGEVPVAIVVRKPAATLDEQTLLAFLSDRLGRFKLPRRIEFTEEPLPKTGTGKIRKTMLREKYWAGMTRRVHG
ncbi:MAG TPA: long-chain-fatty-acid--CoA ligase [Bryobacteraceae bacterium]|nr:long-chain-fatty-acid--CoA ligase [Bryobacteraceae bacterium]